MYRVCIGKASKDTGSEKGSQGHGKRGKYLPRMARTNTETRNNYLLRAEREKKSFDQREIRNLNYKRIIIYNNNNNIHQQLLRSQQHSERSGVWADH